jgi:hypothetical protein
MQIVPNQFSGTSYGKLALQFAEALGEEDFKAVYAFLAPALQQKYSVSSLESSYRQTIAYDENGVLGDIEVMAGFEAWPSKEPQDLGWVYVSLDMGEYGEAIAVVVTKDLLVRHIEWGRP